MHDEVFVRMLHGGADVAEQRDPRAQAEPVRVGPASTACLRRSSANQGRPSSSRPWSNRLWDVRMRQRGQDPSLLQETLRLQAAVPAPVQALDRRPLQLSRSSRRAAYTVPMPPRPSTARAPQCPSRAPVRSYRRRRRCTRRGAPDHPPLRRLHRALGRPASAASMRRVVAQLGIARAFASTARPRLLRDHRAVEQLRQALPAHRVAGSCAGLRQQERARLAPVAVRGASLTPRCSAISENSMPP